MYTDVISNKWLHNAHAVSSKILDHNINNKFLNILESIPSVQYTEYNFSDYISIYGKLNNNQNESLMYSIQRLSPWRKGPFELFSHKIESEWRCDLKWSRLKNYINIQDLNVLDVGCANGYYMFRMLESGAKQVFGVDPTLQFYWQYKAIQKLLPELPMTYFPITFEQSIVPGVNAGFDAIFSMGVLYHRRSPFEHLTQLKSQLSTNGILVLETITADSGELDENFIITPKDKYAGQANVWMIPSVNATKIWLTRTGFTNIRIISITKTTKDEQRVTAFSRDKSLDAYLNPLNNNLTIEGYPAPYRTIFLANKTKSKP